MLETRLARLDDAAAITELQIKSWRYRGINAVELDDSDEVKKSWEYAIASLQSTGRVLVVESGVRVVGFCAITTSEEFGNSELVALEVDPDFRREGVATRLMNAAADIAARMNTDCIRAWVSTSETAAQSLLAGTGWRESGAKRVTRTDGGTTDESSQAGRERQESEWITFLID